MTICGLACQDRRQRQPEQDVDDLTCGARGNFPNSRRVFPNWKQAVRAH